MSEHKLCRRCSTTQHMEDMHRVEDLWVCGPCFKRWQDRQKGS